MSVEGYRLSPQQRRLWRLSPHTSPFRVQARMRIEGALDPGKLSRALEELIQHHEVLRTTFPVLPGLDSPVQVVNAHATPEWSCIDLRGLPPAERLLRAQAQFEEAALRPFPLQTGPLVRVTLATLDTGQHLLGLVLPAMCADAASLRLICLEFQQRYEGRASEDGEEPLSYLSFSEWQNELLEESADPASPGPAFWAKQGPSTGPAVMLPLERRPGAAQPFSPASSSFELDSDRTSRLEGAARSVGCSVEALMMAAYGALISKLTSQPDQVLGVLSDGREHADLAKGLGLISRWLPLRQRFALEQPLSEVAQQLDESRTEALEWQRYFVWPVQEGDVTAGRDYPAIGFHWEERRQPPPGSPLFRFESEQAYVDSFKLSLRGARTGAGIAFELHYDQSVLTGDAVRHLADQLGAVLDHVSRQPGGRIADLPLVTPGERERLLVTFNATDQELPPRCLHSWFEEQAAKHPERPAVCCEGQTLTYAELEARANRVAHALIKRGVGPEVRVGMFVTRSLEMIVGMLGALKAGGAYVPLDPTQPRQRLLFLLEDIKAPVVITERRLLKSLPIVEGCEQLCLDADEPALVQEPTHAPRTAVTPENPAYVLFTSGSTGRPKGVIVEHRQLYNYVASVMERLDLPAGATYATVSTFAADLGNTVVFPALVNGSCLHVISTERASDPIALAEYTSRHRIDCLKIVPSHLRALLSSGRADVLLPKQRLILGGEATPRAWALELQSQAPGCALYNHYGPTETTVGVMTFRLELARTLFPGNALPLERPVANTRIYVLDSALQPAPVGVAGEIYISGAALSRGYLHRPDLTAQAFIPDPHSKAPGARMYRTGDLGRHLPDGTLEHLGRADDQVKYHGHRIELAELRHALNQHPQVRDSVVLLRKDASGNEVLVAYYVSRQEIEREQLRAFLGERVIDEVLPNIYVQLKKLPLTLNGKIHFDALPSIDEARRRMRQAVVAPRTPNEATLAAIWCQVLNLKEVSVHDNFFSLGGDSILGILVVSKANQAGLKLSPRQLFQHQTIAELAGIATAASPGTADESPVTGPVPLLPIQRWFFDQEMPDPDAWCVVVPLEARQPLEPGHMERALTALLHHHDVLRLRVRKGSSGWEASIAPAEGPMPMERCSLASMPDAALDTELHRVAQSLRSRLRLADGPTVLAAWADLGPHRPARLLIVAHRLVIDGVSWRILFEQLQDAYQQIAGGQEPQLPPRTNSLKTWAERLRAHTASPAMKEELAYWTSGSWSTVGPLPVDKPAATLPATLDPTVTVSLSPDESRALIHEAAEKFRCELGEMLIAALAETLSGWTGQPALMLDVEGHGREDLFQDVDLSRTVGWFTSLCPVLLTPEREGGLGATVKAIKDQLRAVPSRGLGYGVLRYLSSDAEMQARLASRPAAEALFRYVGQYNALSGPWFSVLDYPEQQAPTRRHKLAIIARMVEGQLHVTWYASPEMYERATIESLAERHLEALKALLTQASTLEQPAFSPSDFPLAGLNQKQLDKLVSRLKK